MKTEDNTIQHYNEKAMELSGRYESAVVTKLQHTLQSTLNNCSPILELGCGSGRDAAFLMNQGKTTDLTITDGSVEMLRHATRLHPELSSHIKILKLPEGLNAENTRYEGIYSIAVLMHLTAPNIKETLELISQLLTPDGVLFISVCTKREMQPRDDLRSFTLTNRNWWTDQIETTGLKVTTATESTDGLNREKTVWLNITAIKSH